MVAVVVLVMGPRRVGFGLSLGGAIIGLASLAYPGGIDAWFSWIKIVSNYNDEWGAWQLYQPTLRMIAVRFADIVDIGSYQFYQVAFNLIVFCGLVQSSRLSRGGQYEQSLWFLKVFVFSILSNAHAQPHTWVVITPFMISLAQLRMDSIRLIQIGLFLLPGILQVYFDLIGMGLGEAHLLLSCSTVAIGASILFLGPQSLENRCIKARLT